MTAGDSITYQPREWQEVDGVVVPHRETEMPEALQHRQAVVPVKVAPKPRHYTFTTNAIGIWRIDAPAVAKANAASQKAEEAKTVQEAGDSTLTETSDTTAAMDTIAPVYGMVIENPIVQDEPFASVEFDSMSWVFLALSVLFCAVCLKFKSNTRYLKALIDDMTDVRMRTNLFDDTVKETSFLVLLNVMWAACAGVLVWKTICLSAGPPLLGNSFTLNVSPAAGAGISIAVAAVYSVFMLLAYWIVGMVFSDRKRTVMWVKGAAAAQGIEVIFFFPLALLTLCYTPWTSTVLIIAAVVFVLVKIIFIYKGFRIFFNQISSWMLFLYYLCSLEIVPVILMYFGSLYICSLVH